MPVWICFFDDLRQSLTLLRRDRGVSGLIVLVLALGIGGTTAIFTLLKAAFLDALPYRDSGRLVTVMENTGWIPHVSEFLEIRNRARTLEQLAFAGHLDMQLTGTGEPARVFVARVTTSFFPPGQLLKQVKAAIRIAGWIRRQRCGGSSMAPAVSPGLSQLRNVIELAYAVNTDANQSKGNDGGSSGAGRGGASEGRGRSGGRSRQAADDSA
jgi:uncharacterized membrane protein YgcG